MIRFFTGLSCGLAVGMVARLIGAADLLAVYFGLTTALGLWFAERVLYGRKTDR